MIEDHKQALVSWIRAKGYQYFFEGLAEIAADEAAKLEGTEDRERRIEYRQWQRTGRKLQELADWCREFGPGSGCR
jgi:hypothetical protein